jgi:retron-type reverse transcriptase
MWSEAGVMENGNYIETKGLGTPQGGVISPLLSHIYLHAFDKMFQMSGIPGTLVRYADFVILLWCNGKQVKKQVEQMLGRLGLKLHPDKTRVVKAKNGLHEAFFRFPGTSKWPRHRSSFHDSPVH